MADSDLVAMSVHSGDQTIVTPGPVTLMDVSSDGRFVLFCHARMGENGPVAVIDVSSGLELNIPLMQGEWATAGTLASSDLAFVGTTAGRIVEFFRLTGKVETLLSITTQPDKLPGNLR